MVQLGLQHQDQGARCFELLAAKADQFRLRGALHRWKLKSHVNLNQFQSLEESSQAALEDMQLSRSERIQVAREVWTAALALQSRESAIAMRLRTRAIASLARQMQAGVIREYLELDTSNDSQRGFASLVDDPFVAAWVQGYLAWDQSFRENQISNAKQAIASLERAKQLVTTSTNELDQELNHYLLFQAKFSANASAVVPVEWIEQLNDLSANLDRLGRADLGESAGWLCVRAAVRISQQRDDTAFVFGQVSRFLATYPESNRVPTAKLLRAKFANQTLPYEQALANYQRLRKDARLEIQADMEIARLKFHRWDRNKTPETWLSFAEAYRRLVKSESVSLEVAVEAKLLMFQAKIREPDVDIAQLQAWFANEVQAKFDELSQDASRGNGLAAELLKCRCQLMLADQQYEQALQIQRRLATEYPASQGYKVATALLAAQVEQQYASNAETDDKPDVGKKISLPQAIQLFEQMVQTTGASDDQLRRNVNARVALFRLANLRLQNQQLVQANKIANRLVKLFPKRMDYRRFLAQASQQAGQTEQAIDHWKRIVDSAPPGTAAWYEARLEMTACLLKANRKDAAKTWLRQTQVLSPDFPDVWQQRYDDLSNRLGDD